MAAKPNTNIMAIQYMKASWGEKSVTAIPSRQKITMMIRMISSTGAADFFNAGFVIVPVALQVSYEINIFLGLNCQSC